MKTKQSTPALLWRGAIRLRAVIGLLVVVVVTLSALVIDIDSAFLAVVMVAAWICGAFIFMESLGSDLIAQRNKHYLYPMLPGSLLDIERHIAEFFDAPGERSLSEVVISSNLNPHAWDRIKQASDLFSDDEKAEIDKLMKNQWGA